MSGSGRWVAESGDSSNREPLLARNLTQIDPEVQKVGGVKLWYLQNHQVFWFSVFTIAFVAFTAVVGYIDWIETPSEPPPTCVKGGAAAVLSPPGGGEGDSAFVMFSGKAKHSRLVNETAAFPLPSGHWQRLWPVAAEHDLVRGVAAPTPRWKASAVRANRTAMLMFGGTALKASSVDWMAGKGAARGGEVPSVQGALDNEAEFVSELWLLSMEGDTSPRWELLSNSSAIVGGKDISSPGPRRSHAAVMIERSMILFGGKDCSTFENGTKKCTELGDLWRYDLERGNWSLLWSPPAMVAHGLGGAGLVGEVPGWPSARHGHSAVHVRAHNATEGRDLDYFVVYGGRTEDGTGKHGYYDDVWGYCMQSGKWVDFTPDYEHSVRADFPAHRNHHAAFAWRGNKEAKGGQKRSSFDMMLISGGRGAPRTDKHQHMSSIPLSDTWWFDFQRKKWKQVRRSGQWPSARWLAATAEYSESEGEITKFLLFGGDDGERHSRLNDIWSFDPTLSRWERLLGSTC